MPIGYQLSPQQNILIQYPGSASSISIWLPGVLDCNILEAALRSLREDEIMLNTRIAFIGRSNMPLMVSHQEVFYMIRVEQPMEHFSGSERLLSLHSFSQSPADSVLLSVVVDQYSDQACLHFLAPSVILDIKSIVQVVVRLISVYEDLKDSVPPCSVTYYQYAEWASKMLESKGDNDQEFWKKQLVSIPKDSRITLQMQTKEPNSGLIRALKIVEDSENVHLTGTTKEIERKLLTCWGIFLWWFSGKQDSVTGIYNGGREFEQLNSCVGSFGKVLPFFVHMKESQTIDHVLAGSAAQLENLDRHKSFYSIDNFTTCKYSFDIIDLTSTGHILDVASVLNIFPSEDLKLSVALFPAGSAKLRLLYETESFLHSDTEYFLDVYKHVLRLVESGSTIPISDIFLAYTSRWSCASLSGEPLVNNPRGSSLTSQFLQCGLRFAHRIAIVTPDRSFTYGELFNASIKTSHYLKSELNIVQGDIVAVCMDPCWEMVVGILGVMLAGGTYVPIDLNSPAERNSYIIENSKSKVVLTNGSSNEFIPDPCSTVSVRMILQAGAVCVDYIAEEPDIAYVIYTSGTTGKPKGTQVPAKALSNYVDWFTTTFSITERDSTVLSTSIAYDLGYTAFWGALLSGACLHILTEDSVKDPYELVTYVCTKGITFIKTAPTQFNLMTREMKNLPRDSEIRLVLLGGEKIHVSDIFEWLAMKADIQFINHYGPTETTIGTIFFPIPYGSLNEYRKRPIIGRPISNATVEILDNNRRPVIPGVIGEICISGVGLATGYLGLIDQTELNFVNHPYHPGRKIYCTGDFGTWTPDHSVLLIGRRDDQVKIRGYRVELSEIQTVIESIPEVDRCALAVNTHPDYGKEIIAFYTLRTPVEESLLWRHIKKRLPVFMWPVVLKQAATIPQTANGKADISALTKTLRHSEIIPDTSTCDALHEKLLALWKEILGRNDFDLHDNFFHLGGHSLKAIKLVSAIHRQMNVRLNIKTIFLHPTVAALAEAIRSNVENKFSRIFQAPPSDSYALSHPQIRVWFMSQLKGGNVSFNMPFAAWVNPPLKSEILYKVFLHLIQKYEILRTIFVVIADEPRQKILPFKEICFKIDTLDLNRSGCEEEAMQIIRNENNAPFDLAVAPLFRVKLLQLTSQRQVFLFTLHHIISDAWSREVFLREASTLFAAYSAGEDPPVVEPKVQYKDYTYWLEQEIERPIFKKQEEFWLKKLQGPRSELHLETDFSSTARKPFAGGTVNGKVDEAVVRLLREFVRTENVTAFSVILATYALLLHKITGQTDLLIGTPAAAREHDDLRNMLGMFVNTVVVRISFKGTWTYRELVESVAEAAMEALSNQQYPFNLVVQKLGLQRHRNRPILIQTGLNWTPYDRNLDYHKFSLGPAKLNRIEIPWSTSKWDVWLFANEFEKELDITFEYNSSLFTESRIILLRDRFSFFLEAALQNPNVLINAIPDSAKSQGHSFPIGRN